MKHIKLTIEEEGRETRVLETNGFLGTIIADELPGGGSDTTQIFTSNGINEKELIKLLAGNINTVYRIYGDLEAAKRVVDLAAKVAELGYIESKSQGEK